MTFTSVDSIVTSKTLGKSNKTRFNKTIVTGVTSAAGRWHECLSGVGTNGPITLTGTAGTGIVCNGSTAGGLTVKSDVAPDLRYLLDLKAFTAAATAVPGVLVLTDIIHIYPSCVLTGTPTTLSNHPTWTGTGDTRMTNANGVQASLIVTTAGTAGNGQITPTYLNQTGASKTGGSLYAPVATAPAGCLYGAAAVAVTPAAPEMSLAAGDYGVQRISSYTINTGLTSGVGAFILHRPIEEIPLAAANVAGMLEWILGNRIYDDACLGFFIQIGGALTANNTISGSFTTVWG